MNMKKVFSRAEQKYQGANQAVFSKSCALSAVLMTCPLMAFAKIGSGVGTVDWPWTKFLNSLASQLTGPLPMALGILGIAVAAMGMFMGNHGAGMQKLLVLIFAVSICLFAPSFISYISTSAGDSSGLLILSEL